MQEHDSALRTQVLPPVENQTGIPSSEAKKIADHYRNLGGFRIDLKEDMFRADILVTPLPTAYTTFQAVQS